MESIALVLRPKLLWQNNWLFTLPVSVYETWWARKCQMYKMAKWKKQFFQTLGFKQALVSFLLNHKTYTDMIGELVLSELFLRHF